MLSPPQALAAGATSKSILPRLTSARTTSGGGGIGGNVDNWENEEDVILPVN